MMLKQNNPPKISNTPRFDMWSISPEQASYASSIASKATPLAMENWVKLSLTLDGRDKITKLVQYTSRLIGYYFEVLARSYPASALYEINDTIHNDKRMKWMEKAKRFRNLQRALTESRKAYRLGRSLVEVQKLKEMGIFHWVPLYLRQCILRDPLDSSQDCEERDNRNEQRLHLQRGHQTKSYEGYEDVKLGPPIITSGAQYLETKSSEKEILTNTNTDERKTEIAEDNLEKQTQKQKQKQKQNDDRRDNFLSKTENIFPTKKYGCRLPNKALHPQPPMWKIISGAFKLVGLAGFWAGDNVSYLYQMGFWIDEKIDKVTTTNEKNQLMDKSGKNAGAAIGMGKNAAIFATRSYFFAALAGLYLSTREWFHHRNGPLREAIDRVSEMEIRKDLLTRRTEDSDKNVAMEEKYERQERMLRHLEDIKRKHFVLCLSLFKSCCDIAAFSNNPGVDLHQKYRGRKMNEGLQCLFGIMSASTVLYSKFPSATTVNA